MDTDIIYKLEQLHLSPSEAKVYLSLSKIGQSSAGKIIKDTGLHRSVVYESLDKLIDKKLVFKLEKRKIAYFQPTNPDRFLQTVKTEESIAQELIPYFKTLIDTKLPEITIYEGIESYRNFWVDLYKSLPVGSVNYVVGSIGKKFQEYMGPYEKKFAELKNKKKIKWKLIVFANDKYEIEFLKKYPELNEYRFIGKKIAKVGNFNILNDDMIILHSLTEPLIILIKNKGLAAVLRDTFDVIWDAGKPKR